MIAKLTGIIDKLFESSLILDVRGVGYIVHTSPRNLSNLGEGEEASLYIETILRQESLSLFGFLSLEEKETFNTLCLVQGVGAKMALSILNMLSPNEIAGAILAADKTTLTRADGVGMKLATRLVTELKDKIGKIGVVSISSSPKQTGDESVMKDTLSALVNLGYSRSQAHLALTKALEEGGGSLTVDSLIPKALKYLNQSLQAGGL